MKNFNLFSNKHFRIVAVSCLLFTLCVGNAWGDELYSNAGATGTSSGVTASGNVNNNNGNPAPSFANTSSSNTTFTFTGFDVSDYENLELSIDAKFNSFPYTTNTWPYVTVTFLKNSVAVLTDNTTIKWTSKDNAFGTYTIDEIPDFDAITIVCSPASGKSKQNNNTTQYATYLDNITLTGDEKSSGSNYTLVFKDPSGTKNGDDGSVSANATSFTLGSTKPSKTGHHLIGFYKESSLTNLIADTARTGATVTGGKFRASTDYTNSSKQYTETAGHDLYLKWEADSYAVTSTLTNCSASSTIPSSVSYTGSGLGWSYTITPSDGYALPSSITLTMGGVAMTSGTDYTWNSSTGALTVSKVITGPIVLTITAVRLYTITFNDNGSTTNYVWQNGSVHATPSIVACDEQYDVLGWTTTAPTSNAWATQPSYTAAGGNITVSGDATYYAVYTEEGETPTNNYKKITNSSEFISGRKYVITNTGDSKALDCSTFYTDASFPTTSVSPSSGIITTTTAAIIYTITGDNTGGFSIYSEEDSGTGIGYGYSNTHSKDTLNWYGSAKTHWKITISDANVYIQPKNALYDYLYCESSYYWLKTTATANHLFKQMYNTLYIANPVCCDKPTALTKGSISLSDRTAQVQPINWTSEAGKVDICYSTNSYKPGATPGSGYTVVSNITSSPYNLNITSFAADDYYVWARSVCDESTKSDWIAITGSYFTVPGHTLTISADPDGSGTFSKSPDISTVVENRQVAITASPAAGYTFTSWAVSGTGSTLSSTSDNPTTFTMGTANATVTGTFTAKALTAWAWKYKKGDVGNADPATAIPDVVEAYIGEYVRFVIDGYTPSDVIAAKQGYVYDQDADPKQPVYNTDSLAYVAKNAACTYYTTRGKVAGTATLKFKAVGDGSITKTMTILTKALPSVTFVDVVHNKTDFSNWGKDGVVSSTVTTGVVDHTQPTPSHSDVSDPGSNYNTCERQHIHLVGWIRSDWADEHPSATHSQITSVGDDDSGNPYYYTAGADIDIEAQNGKFYAVWSKIE